MEVRQMQREIVTWNGGGVELGHGEVDSFKDDLRDLLIKRGISNSVSYSPEASPQRHWDTGARLPSICAEGFSPGQSEPRHEPVFLDDGGNFFRYEDGWCQGVLKVTVRNVTAVNQSLQSQIERLMRAHGIDPHAARIQDAAVGENDVQYALIRNGD